MFYWGHLSYGRLRFNTDPFFYDSRCFNMLRLRFSPMFIEYILHQRNAYESELCKHQRTCLPYPVCSFLNRYSIIGKNIHEFP